MPCRYCAILLTPRFSPFRTIQPHVPDTAHSSLLRCSKASYFLGRDHAHWNCLTGSWKLIYWTTSQRHWTTTSGFRALHLYFVKAAHVVGIRSQSSESLAGVILSVWPGILLHSLVQAYFLPLLCCLCLPFNPAVHCHGDLTLPPPRFCILHQFPSLCLLKHHLKFSSSPFPAVTVFYLSSPLSLLSTTLIWHLMTNCQLLCLSFHIK